MSILLSTIIFWLSANFDLPQSQMHPEIAFASPAVISTMHLHGLPQAAATEVASVGKASARQADQIVAVYDDRTQTIYLPMGWTGQTPAELSILVHEMVHHLQNLAGMKYECSQAREKLAFQAQDRWLQMFGSDLLQSFGVDDFTLLVRTNCMF